MHSVQLEFHTQGVRLGHRRGLRKDKDQTWLRKDFVGFAKVFIVRPQVGFTISCTVSSLLPPVWRMDRAGSRSEVPASLEAVEIMQKKG